MLRLRLPTGLSLRLPRNSHFASVAWVTGGHADEGCEELLLQHLRSNADFFDVGAHLGYYSLWCAPRVRRVHAFEPDPRNHAWLASNVGSLEGALIVHEAISSEVGEVTLLQDESSAQSRVEFGPRSAAVRAVTVPCTTLDAYWTRVGQPSVCAIKIDVEGHEIPVLQGGRQLVAACRPTILLETEPAHLLELHAWCDAAGYSVYAAVRETSGMKLAPLVNQQPTGVEFTMAFLMPSTRPLAK